MINKYTTQIILCLLTLAPLHANLAEASREQQQNAFFERDAKGNAEKNPLYVGFALLWLNRDLNRANELINAAYHMMLQQSAERENQPTSKEITPQIAGSERVKWQLRTWVRIYYLFSDKSEDFPSRLSSENQSLIQKLFWNFLKTEKNQLKKRAQLKYVHAIHGSENHEIMRLANLLLAAQALEKVETYNKKTTPEGLTPQQCGELWSLFFSHRWDEMAKHGLLVEAFAGYGKYTLPEMLNIVDFSSDPKLVRKTEMLLHLIWSEWAVAQLNGVRGGARMREYQGNENIRGTNDTWRQMSLFFFDIGPWHTQWHPDPIHGMSRVMASTQYRVPPLIVDIAKDSVVRGEYNYITKRIAKTKATTAKNVPVWWSPWYSFDQQDPRMIAYDHCTPDYIMGCVMLDPRLPRVSSHEYLEGKDMLEGYPNLTTQNHYKAIIFPTDLNARVVPQCLPLSDTHLKTYLQQQVVQHNNIMLVQRHKKSKNTGIMRVFFSNGMKGRLIEKAGWFMLQEGKAFMAVKGFSRKDGIQNCGTSWKDDNWLHLDDGDAPVVFITSREAKHQTMEQFSAYVLSSTSKLSSQCFSFSIVDVQNKTLQLSLFLDATQVPLINGKPINFQPEYVFKSPFFKSKYNSGIITLQKGDKKLVLNFNDSE